LFWKRRRGTRPADERRCSELISGANQMPQALEVAIHKAVGQRGVSVLVLPGDVALQLVSDASLIKGRGELTGAPPVAKLADLGDCDVVLKSLPNDDTLSAVALGPAELPSAMQKVRPLPERFGQRVFVVGEEPALVNLVKLASNALTATTLECKGEVLALLRKGGIDSHLPFDVLTNSLFDSRVHKVYGAKIVEKRYSRPGLAVPLAIEDLRLALAEAERARRCRCTLRASCTIASSR
jgi:hypothetical protein